MLCVVSTACGKEAKSSKPACQPAATSGIVWANCQLTGQDLRGVDLSKSVISDVDLAGANLSGAKFRGANLHQVEFEGAILTDVDLTDATISGGNIQKGSFCNTTMPDGQIASGDC